MTLDATAADPFAGLGLSRPESRERGTNDPTELGLDTFLKLMVTQMNNQDPFEPMDNGDFLAQIAQFGAVSGLDELNRQITDLSGSLTSGQALQAGSLIGREVLVPADSAYLGAAGEVRGQVDLTASTADLTLRVHDERGQLVRELALGGAPAGTFRFTWDGTDDSGAHLPPGTYRLSLSARDGERVTELQPGVFARVDSVNLSARQGLTLNLEGLGPVAFSQVQQIY